MPNMGPMPAGLTPGANFGGNQLALPSSSYSPSTAAVGGSQNPFLAGFPSGQNFPAYGSPYASSGATSDLSALNIGNSLGTSTQDYTKGLRYEGYTRQGATAISNFLAGGAGWNPEVANALIAAMQPQIAAGQANLLEQFSSMGLRGGSPAALGLAGYNAQTNLGVGEIFANLYEQSVQNYMNTLLATSTPKKSGGVLGSLGSLLGGLGGGQGISSLFGALGIGGAAAGGAAAGGAAAAGGGDAAMTALMMAAGFCWVAAEVFDGWDDPRTHDVRRWLLTDFSEHWYGRVTVWLYRHTGQFVAKLVRKYRPVRYIMTKLFNKALEYARH
jgi:hypothetical protein